MLRWIGGVFVSNVQSGAELIKKGTGMAKLVALNEKGRRIGENHPLAKLTDDEVTLVLELLDDGMSLGEVAKKFDVSKSCIQKIADGSRRGQAIARVVSVNV